jgi:hypothetical protein
MQTESQEMPTEICLNIPSLYNVMVSEGVNLAYIIRVCDPCEFQQISRELLFINSVNPVVLM